jgi:hypothetical protein
MGTKTWFFALASLVLFLAALPSQSPGQVGVNVGVALPPLGVPAPPAVVVIPGTYVYLAPGIGVDVFFYHGYWYRPYGGGWFRARGWNGPWGSLRAGVVPRPLLSLPPDYRMVPPGARRIPRADLMRNWAGWERNHYWEKDRAWHEGWHGKGGEARGRPEGHGKIEERRGEPRGHEERRHEEHER